MLDFTKITFNELDDTDKPLQVFYNYDLKESEINDFLEEYATIEEVPEGVSIQKIELCLTVYAQHDFKLEACCTDTTNEQYWVELNNQFVNADELIQLIPDYGKIKINPMKHFLIERKKMMNKIRELFENGNNNYNIYELDGCLLEVITPTIHYLVIFQEDRWMLRVSTVSAFDRWANSTAIEEFFETDIELCKYLTEHKLDIYKQLLEYLSSEYDELESEYDELEAVEQNGSEVIYNEINKRHERF